MPRVIKQDRVVQSGDVVVIPDTAVIRPARPRGAAEDEASSELPPGTVMIGGEPASPPDPSTEEVSRRILQSARGEREKLLEQARAEAEEIREQARAEGRKAGLEEERKQIEGCLREVESVLDEMQEQQHRYMKKFEKELKILALDIAEKVLNKTVSAAGDTEMKELVRQTVLSVKNVEWISVEVSDRLAGLVEWMENELAGQLSVRQMEVSPREAPDGTCIVNTPEGVVDASVDVQIGNLREMFDKMD